MSLHSEVISFKSSVHIMWTNYYLNLILEIDIITVIVSINNIKILKYPNFYTGNCLVTLPCLD